MPPRRSRAPQNQPVSWSPKSAARCHSRSCSVSAAGSTTESTLSHAMDFRKTLNDLMSTSFAAASERPGVDRRSWYLQQGGVVRDDRARPARLDHVTRLVVQCLQREHLGAQRQPRTRKACGGSFSLAADQAGA
jgi:hypothetical protein